MKMNLVATTKYVAQGARTTAHFLFLPASLMSLILIIVAVANAQVPKKDTDGVKYFPTAKGSKWHYKNDNSDEYYVITDVETVSESTKVTVSQIVERDRLVPKDIVMVSEKGLVQYPVNLPRTNVHTVLLKMPFKQGDKWEYETPSDGLFPGEEGVKKAYSSEQLTIMQTKYTTVTVVTEIHVISGAVLMKSIQTKSWYAPGVGLVKQIDRDGKVKVLQKFTPGKSD